MLSLVCHVFLLCASPWLLSVSGCLHTVEKVSLRPDRKWMSYWFFSSLIVQSLGPDNHWGRSITSGWVPQRDKKNVCILFFYFLLFFPFCPFCTNLIIHPPSRSRRPTVTSHRTTPMKQMTQAWIWLLSCSVLMCVALVVGFVSFFHFHLVEDLFYETAHFWVLNLLLFLFFFFNLRTRSFLLDALPSPRLRAVQWHTAHFHRCW